MTIILFPQATAIKSKCGGTIFDVPSYGLDCMNKYSQRLIGCNISHIASHMVRYATSGDDDASQSLSSRVSYIHFIASFHQDVIA